MERCMRICMRGCIIRYFPARGPRRSAPGTAPGSLAAPCRPGGGTGSRGPTSGSPRWRPAPRVRPHCRFRKRRTEHVKRIWCEGGEPRAAVQYATMRPSPSCTQKVAASLSSSTLSSLTTRATQPATSLTAPAFATPSTFSVAGCGRGSLAQRRGRRGVGGVCVCA